MFMFQMLLNPNIPPNRSKRNKPVPALSAKYDAGNLSAARIIASDSSGRYAGLPERWARLYLGKIDQQGHLFERGDL